MQVGLGKRFWMVLATQAVASVGFGWGLSFPGEVGGSNTYYLGVADKLYKLNCPADSVESADCPKDPAFLIRVSAVVSTMESDIRAHVRAVEAAIKKETETLREQNPDVIALRAGIKQSVTNLNAAEAELKGLKDKIAKAEGTKATLVSKLAEISSRLAVEGLTQDELLRLTESRRYYEKADAANAKVLADIAALQTKLTADRKLASDAIDAKSTELGKLIGTLVVDSKNLVGYTAQLKDLAAELALVPDLGARLNDSLVFSVAAWISESSSPAVKPVTDRFLKTADRLNRGTK